MKKEHKSELEKLRNEVINFRNIVEIKNDFRILTYEEKMLPIDIRIKIFLNKN